MVENAWPKIGEKTTFEDILGFIMNLTGKYQVCPAPSPA